MIGKGPSTVSRSEIWVELFKDEDLVARKWYKFPGSGRIGSDSRPLASLSYWPRLVRRSIRKADGAFQHSWRFEDARHGFCKGDGRQ